MISQTKIAVPILQKNRDNILEIAKDYIKKGADILELRIDGISNPNPKMLREIIKEINFPIIATNRSSLEGGYFSGNEEERINLLNSCCDLVEYIDIEIQTDENLLKSILNNCKESDTKTIISFHDFEKTPSIDELLEIVKKAKNIGNIAKIAVMPSNLEDTIIVLAIMSRYKDIIAISMGELGGYTRILASKFNSPITFATGGDVTAPGQIDIETMKLMLNMNIMDHNYLLEDI